MIRFLFYLNAIVGLSLCAEGIHCALKMHAYIGTPGYFTNPWFLKAHACLFAIIACSVASRFLKAKIDASKSS